MANSSAIDAILAALQKSPIFEQENHENSWENDGKTVGTWMIYGKLLGK